MEDEIEVLRQQIEELEREEKDKKEIEALKKRLDKLRFNKKHRKLLKFTRGLEDHVASLAKGAKQGIKTVAKKVDASDKYIEKQKIKERESLKNSKQKKPKDEINEALGWLD